jgi:hypothetical protein
MHSHGELAGQLSDVVLRCAAVTLLIPRAPAALATDAAPPPPLQDITNAQHAARGGGTGKPPPLLQAHGAVAVVLQSPRRALRAAEVLAAVREAARGVPGSGSWVLDGLRKTSAAGQPVVYEAVFML